MKRLTKQRKAILACLQTAKRPLSIEEILSEVSLEVPSFNLSTLYRNLKLMIQENEVQPLELPGKSSRYALVDGAHTHHFLCQRCNRLFNIFLCPKEIVSMVPQGFTMLNHSITLTGLCRDCKP